MSLVAGIDYDSNAVYTVAIAEDDGAFAMANKVDLACGPGDAFDRARRARDLLPARTRWEDAGVVALGIEETFSHAFKAAVALARVEGAILACLPRDLVVLPLAAAHHGGWKELTVGKTNASKAEVIEWALANGAPPRLEHDFYDAFAIARATALLWQTRRRPAALTKGSG